MEEDPLKLDDDEINNDFQEHEYESIDVAQLQNFEFNVI